MNRMLNGHVLKLIAAVTMFVDHVAAGIYYPVLGYYYLDSAPWADSVYQLFRDIGRTAFPIFAFLLVEGFVKTRSRLKFAIRLFVFAIISEIPFQLLFELKFSLGFTNVFFTLLIGFLVVWGLEEIGIKGLYEENISPFKTFAKIILSIVVVAIGMFVAFAIDCDYRQKGVLLIAVFYLLRDVRTLAVSVGYLSFLWEPWSVFGFFLLTMYNGERGKQLKYFYYLFYPAHLIILFLVRYRIVGF